MIQPKDPQPGEVWTANLGPELKTRPIVIAEHWGGGFCTACKITTTRNRGIYLPIGESGLHRTSYAQTRDTLAVPKERFIKKIGTIDAITLDLVLKEFEKPTFWL